MKCHCGYEATTPTEIQALENWGCAKAVAVRTPPFNSLTVTSCGSEDLGDQDDSEAFKEAFRQKYEKQ